MWRRCRRVTSAIGLRACYAVSGTDVARQSASACGRSGKDCSTSAYGTGSHCPRRLLCDVQYWPIGCAALSPTVLAAIVLGICYAMPGTGCVAMSPVVLAAIVLGVCYGMSGTEVRHMGH
eukprot:3941911-Rhodomonas_salina.2